MVKVETVDVDSEAEDAAEEQQQQQQQCWSVIG